MQIKTRSLAGLQMRNDLNWEAHISTQIYMVQKSSGS